jgi:hypothetical protein
LSAVFCNERAQSIVAALKVPLDVGIVVGKRSRPQRLPHPQPLRSIQGYDLSDYHG